ncbi:MAG: FAD binding domain-containing protein [Elusimicrobiota bacterium]
MRDYIRPKNFKDIREEVGTREAYYLAGGTDLMVMKKEDELKPDRPWVDLTALEDELKGIELRDDHLVIGALTTMSELTESQIIRKNCPAIAFAAEEMGSPLIRNLATIGGNLANSNPAGDIIPPVHVFESELLVPSHSRVKEIPVSEFFLGPGDNILEPGEIIKAVKIPLKKNSYSGFRKLGPRKALAISKVSVAARWEMEDKEVKDISIALGAVGATCILADKTSDYLKGRRINKNTLAEARDIIETEACPIDDFRSSARYRREMTGVLLKRILTQDFKKLKNNEV